MSAMYRFVVLASLLLVASPATAQTTLGLKGGVGLANVSIDEAGLEEESVSRIVAGVELGVPLSSVFSLRLGGMYAPKGGAVTVEGVGVTLNLDYIQLSALARAATSSDGGLSIGVTAGPWAAYRLSCDVEAAAQGFNISVPCDDADFSDFAAETLDFGLALGGGVELPLYGSFRLGVDALYSLGLASVGGRDTKTRHLTVQTGVVFPIA